VAHWDEERDKRWVEMMKAFKHPPDLHILIQKFEESDDIAYWTQFIEAIRTAL